MSLGELHRDTNEKSDSISFPEYLLQVGEDMVIKFVGKCLILLHLPNVLNPLDLCVLELLKEWNIT